MKVSKRLSSQYLKEDYADKVITTYFKHVKESLLKDDFYLSMVQALAKSMLSIWKG